MTGGQVAGLIAAIAFLILVLFIGMFLVKMNKTLGEVNRSMKSMTSDIDVISHQAEDIMANANELLTDVNKKVATIDPVFQAAADLGESVSDQNTATRNLTDRVGVTAKKTAKTSMAARVSKTAFDLYRNRKNKN